MPRLFRGTLKQLIDPLDHQDDHETLIDGIGQEFCLDCACSRLRGKDVAILQKTHIVALMDQIISVQGGAETLVLHMAPTVISSLASLGEHCSDRTSIDDSALSKLREALVNLGLNTLGCLHENEAELVTDFVRAINHEINIGGCGPQKALVHLLGRCVHIHNGGEFIDRLLHSSLLCASSEPLSDVLYILATAAAAPLQHSADSDSADLDFRSNSQQDDRPRAVEKAAVSLAAVALSCVRSVSSSLIGQLDKLASSSCWANAFTLLVHLSSCTEVLGADDIITLFETLVLGSAQGRSSSTPRIGIAARAHLVQIDNSAVTSIGEMFESISNLSESLTRQLLRDGVGEFALSGLSASGSPHKSNSTRQALARLLDTLSQNEPISFFHPSAFHPFAFQALLDAVRPSGDRLRSIRIESGVSAKSSNDIDYVKHALPLVRIIRRSLDFSTALEHVGVHSVLSVLGECISSVTTRSLGALPVELNDIETVSEILVLFGRLIGVARQQHEQNKSLVSGDASLSATLRQSIELGKTIIHSAVSCFGSSEQIVESSLYCATLNNDDDLTWAVDVFFNFPALTRILRNGPAAGVFATYIHTLLGPSSETEDSQSEKRHLAQLLCDRGYLAQLLWHLAALASRDADDDEDITKVKTAFNKCFLAVAGHLVIQGCPLYDGLQALSIVCHGETPESIPSRLIEFISKGRTRTDDMDMIGASEVALFIIQSGPPSTMEIIGAITSFIRNNYAVPQSVDYRDVDDAVAQVGLLRSGVYMLNLLGRYFEGINQAKKLSLPSNLVTICSARLIPFVSTFISTTSKDEPSFDTAVRAQIMNMLLESRAISFLLSIDSCTPYLDSLLSNWCLHHFPASLFLETPPEPEETEMFDEITERIRMSISGVASYRNKLIMALLRSVLCIFRDPECHRRAIVMFELLIRCDSWFQAETEDLRLNIAAPLVRDLHECVLFCLRSGNAQLGAASVRGGTTVIFATCMTVFELARRIETVPNSYDPIHSFRSFDTSDYTTLLDAILQCVPLLSSIGCQEEPSMAMAEQDQEMKLACAEICAATNALNAILWVSGKVGQKEAVLTIASTHRGHALKTLLSSISPEPSPTQSKENTDLAAGAALFVLLSHDYGRERANGPLPQFLSFLDPLDTAGLAAYLAMTAVNASAAAVITTCLLLITAKSLHSYSTQGHLHDQDKLLGLAHHHMLSPIRAVSEAACGLLLQLISRTDEQSQDCASDELEWCNSWHRIFVEEVFASMEGTDDGKVTLPGPFCLLVLAATFKLQSATTWVHESFARAFSNTNDHWVTSFFCDEAEFEASLCAIHLLSVLEKGHAFEDFRKISPPNEQHEWITISPNLSIPPVLFSASWDMDPRGICVHPSQLDTRAMGLDGV